MRFCVNIYVRNGFPIVACGEVMPADREVGITESYLDDVTYSTPKGSPVDFLKLTKDELRQLEDDVMDALACRMCTEY